MKHAFGTLLALSLLAIVLHVTKAEDNIFQNSFQRLHREPPTSPSKNRATIQTLWIEQKVDNFNVADTRTWKMRVYANDEHFKTGGPIFIFVGGEWTISTGHLVGGHMYDMAKEHNGYLYYTEHRYYGESHPTEDISNENIQYLSVNQSLADLAHFIKTQKATVAGLENSKVILVGGSYSATMVTWFKRVYPDLATGCWASSAPLFAKTNFIEYKEIMGQSMRLLGGDACYNRIEKGIAELEFLFDQKRGAEVKAMLQLCGNFDESSDLDLWTLFNEISEIFASVVQAHNAGQIEGVCSKILAESSDLIGVAKYILGEFKKSRAKCHDLSYNAIIATMMDSTYNGGMMRQWIYQTCNEYGWYQTSGSRAQPFGTKFPLALFTTMCEDAYGLRFSNAYIHNQVNITNTYFGGLEPAVENVYMTHGHLDPWRAMGIQDATQATIIPNYAHCKDFGSISDKDTAEMRASKQRIAQLVREWVK